MKAFGGARFETGLAPLIYVLLLSGVWQSEAKVRRSAHDLPHGPVDDLLDPIFADPSTAPDGDNDPEGNGARRRVLSPTDRLGYCDETTVSHLTPFHFQIIEGGLRVYRCWTPRVGRLIGLLQAEQQGRGASGPGAGADEGGRGGRQRLSANEGSRLRCRILFKFDTCRSNFAKYRSTDSPEISTEWPEEILSAINGQEKP